MLIKKKKSTGISFEKKQKYRDQCLSWRGYHQIRKMEGTLVKCPERNEKEQPPVLS